MSKPTDKPGSQLVSKANCLEAAKKQFGNKVVSTRSLLQTENWDWVPKGCGVPVEIIKHIMELMIMEL